MFTDIPVLFLLFLFNKHLILILNKSYTHLNIIKVNIFLISKYSLCQQKLSTADLNER